MYFIGHISKDSSRAKDSNYGVAQFQTSGDSPEPGTLKVICGDILPEFTKQDRLRVYGNPEVSEKYGPQLKIDSILPEPRNAQGYRNFLIHRVSTSGPSAPTFCSRASATNCGRCSKKQRSGFSRSRGLARSWPAAWWRIPNRASP